MRRLILLALILVSAATAAAAERIFIVTDRNTYIAGDLVFCSVYALDQNGRLKDHSAVSYLELISAQEVAAEAKISLIGGMGCGSFRIPKATPTGNYRLMGYTAGDSAETELSPVLSIFNVNSTERVEGGVVLTSGQKTKNMVERHGVGGVSISIPARLRQGKETTLLAGGFDKDAKVCVSVSHVDGLPEEHNPILANVLGGRAEKTGDARGEYEGEVISASVDCPGTAIISTVGAPQNVYVGQADGGKVNFYTNNIYGDRELVCELLPMEGKTGHVRLNSPFTHPSPGQIPSLELCSSQRGDLINRKASLKAVAPLDTLVNFLPKREDLLLEGNATVRYHLDDYTRFPTVEEICTEFVRELSFGQKDGRWILRMHTTDATETRHYTLENILVMMDGVVLSDHGILRDFDALLLEDIDVYRSRIAVGGLSFNGAVNFISKNKYVMALNFPENTQIVDFKGVSYPVAYTGALPGGKDLRELLFWHPQLDIPAGSDLRITIHTPEYSGTFKAVIQGIKDDGSPIFAEYYFNVE